MQLSSQLILDLEQAIQNHQIEEIKRLITQVNRADLADLLANLTLDKQLKLIEYLPHAAYVFEFLSLTEQLEIALRLPKVQLVQLITEMHSDDSTDLFKILPLKLQHDIYAQLTTEKQQQIKQLAQYAEESAGAIMSSDFVMLSSDLTMTEAIAQLRLQAADRETLYLIYIVDHDLKLLGVVSLREIILAILIRYLVK